jgi:hypothetical protein
MTERLAFLAVYIILWCTWLRLKGDIFEYNISVLAVILLLGLWMILLLFVTIVSSLF